MSLVPYWWVIDVIVIMGVFAIALFWVFRSEKQRKVNPKRPPQTVLGRIGFLLLYILRILGVGGVTILAIILGVMFERNIYAFITETAPAPSHVILPADLSFTVEDVRFEGGDGFAMSGWKVPSQNGVTIILLHGYDGNCMAMLWHAQQLVEAGYGVLLYDERASGESEGTRRSYGWEDPRDVAGAIRFIQTESGGSGERIGIGGCSIGAQIALQSAAEYPELEAVWADGPASVRAQDMPVPRNPIVALVMLGNYSLDWVYEIGLHMDAPAPMIHTIGNIAPRPIMMVGGGTSQPFFGSEAEMMIPRYAQFAGPNAQTWIVPEAVHCDGPNHRPDEYARRMVEFFDTAFGITQ
ncbi:MAG: alpha/beta hydrolase [Anaerolineales bacterium]